MRAFFAVASTTVNRFVLFHGHYK